jgi:hypothetical protein
MTHLSAPALKLVYCDYIADVALRAFRSDKDPAKIIDQVGPVRSDLHPEGYLLSLKKTIQVVDRNGRAYRVTIEEVTP